MYRANSRSYSRVFVVVVVMLIIGFNAKALWNRWTENEMAALRAQLNRTIELYSYEEYNGGEGEYEVSDEEYELINENINLDIPPREGHQPEGFQPLRKLQQFGSETSQEAPVTPASPSQQQQGRKRSKCFILVNFMKNESKNVGLIQGLIHVVFLEYSSIREVDSKQYLIRVKILNYEPTNEDPMQGIMLIKFFSSNPRSKVAKLCSVPVRFLSTTRRSIKGLIQASFLPPFLRSKNPILDASCFKLFTLHATSAGSMEQSKAVKFLQINAPTEAPITGSNAVKFLPIIPPTEAPTVKSYPDKFLPFNTPTEAPITGSNTVTFLPINAPTEAPMEESYAVKLLPINAPTEAPITGSNAVKFLPIIPPTEAPTVKSYPDKFLPFNTPTEAPITGSNTVTFLPINAPTEAPMEESYAIKFLPINAQTVETTENDVDLDKWPSLNEHLTWDSMRYNSDDATKQPEEPRPSQEYATKECVFYFVLDEKSLPENISFIKLLSNNSQKVIIYHNGVTYTNASVKWYFKDVRRGPFPHRFDSLGDLIFTWMCCFVVEVILLAGYLATLGTDYSTASTSRIVYELIGFWCIDMIVLKIYLNV